MSSPKWDDLAHDDLAQLLRDTLREHYGQGGVSAGSWEQLAERLTRQNRGPRQRWQAFWRLNVVPWMSSMAVSGMALAVAAGLLPMRSTTLVMLKLAPLRVPVVTISYETAPPALPARPVKRLAKRNDPVTHEMLALAVASAQQAVPPPAGSARPRDTMPLR